MNEKADGGIWEDLSEESGDEEHVVVMYPYQVTCRQVVSNEIPAIAKEAVRTRLIDFLYTFRERLVYSGIRRPKAVS